MSKWYMWEYLLMYMRNGMDWNGMGILINVQIFWLGGVLWEFEFLLSCFLCVF